ncbi:MAG: sigma-54-dependent transcriptional regulator [Janthinobacterium lividum]
MPHALIIEDDPNSLSGLAAILSADGFSVDTAATLAEARQALTRFIPDIVLMDLNLPDGKGLDLLQYLPLQPPDAAVPVIVMTGNATVESAVEGLRHGIWDYLIKPVSIPRLRSLLARIPRPYELTEEVQTLRAALRELGRFGSMVGRADATQRVYDAIERVAPTEAAVLVVGEPGSGKETTARTIHETSRRKKGPFVPFDCRTESTGRPFASLLFGQERNGASSPLTIDERETGVLERAAGGTLFLEEITALPIEQQQTLLNAVKARVFQRIGGSQPIAADFRLICSTTEDPRDAVAQGKLLNGLLEALDMVVMPLPSLRERSEDILLLAEYFVEQANRRDGVRKRLGGSSVTELVAGEWPGNVAELRTRVEAAHSAAEEVIETLEIGEDGRPLNGAGNGSNVVIAVGTPLAVVEELLIRTTLEAVGGTRHRAASILGISPKTLYNKLQRMKIE